ncbi:MAG: DUF6440 family protein [Bacillota bacterium]|nr:DUF6440 family protein [Bacillota bacterium]
MAGADGYLRFRTVYEQKTPAVPLSGFRIFEDAETGVQYLFVWDGYAGGLTDLIDREGFPVQAPRRE